MTLTSERFKQGMTYEEAKARMPRNLSQMEQNERDLKLTEEDLRPWRSLSQTYNVLVLVIDPCPDVYTNLPILERIATETGQLNIRIFMRDENKDLMAQFMNGPYESMPVFAFYDQAFNLRGVFIERPKSVTDLRAQKTRDIHERTPEFGPAGTSPAQMAEETRERYQAAIRDMRADMTQFYVSESIRELGRIADDLAANPAAAKWRGNLLGVPA